MIRSTLRFLFFAVCYFGFFVLLGLADKALDHLAKQFHIYTPASTCKHLSDI